MRFAHIGGVDRRQLFALDVLQFAGIDQFGHARQNASLFGHVRRLEARTREHHFPMNADAFELVRIADLQRPRRLHDQADMALRDQQFAEHVPIA